MARYISFIVRVWSPDKGGLHGQITHVATQAKRYFVKMDDMVNFILDQVCKDRPGEGCPPSEGEGGHGDN